MKLNLIEQLGHNGAHQNMRKLLKHDGNPDVSLDGRDPGNWVYAVCLRYMLKNMFPGDPWRLGAVEELGDGKAGDILEAIWGLLWHHKRDWEDWRHDEKLKGVGRFFITPDDLEEYCGVLTDLVQLFDSFHPHYLKDGEWPTSHEMANMLMCCCDLFWSLLESSTAVLCDRFFFGIPFLGR